VGELVKEKSLHDGWDAELDCYIVNDDLVCIFRNPRLMVAATDPCMQNATLLLCAVVSMPVPEMDGAFVDIIIRKEVL
jgi:hypothetical protein